MNCCYCRGRIPNNAVTCPHCGAPVTAKDADTAEPCPHARPSPPPDFTGGRGYTYAPPVYPPPPQKAVSGKNRYIAAILGILLGGLGVHNFYLGRTGRGLFQLIICWTGISGIWGFIEGLLCLFGSYKDGNGLPLA